MANSTGTRKKPNSNRKLRTHLLKSTFFVAAIAMKFLSWNVYTRSFVVLAFQWLLAITCSDNTFAQKLEPVGEIEKVGPIKPVGPIDPVGKLDPIGNDDKSTTRKQQTSVYLACWTENMRVSNPKWKCSEQYVDNPRDAYEFTEYKRWQYPSEKGGDAFAFEIRKKDWENSESQKKIMERIQKEFLPKYLKRKTGFVLDWTEVDWIDIKPVLSEKEKEAYKEGKVLPISEAKAFAVPGSKLPEKALSLVGTEWLSRGDGYTITFKTASVMEAVSADGVLRSEYSYRLEGDRLLTRLTKLTLFKFGGTPYLAPADPNRERESVVEKDRISGWHDLRKK